MLQLSYNVDACGYKTSLCDQTAFFCGGIKKGLVNDVTIDFLCYRIPISQSISHHVLNKSLWVVISNQCSPKSSDSTAQKSMPFFYHS